MTDAPIGIFDSGVGGLTVARAILDQLPHEQVLYVSLHDVGRHDARQPPPGQGRHMRPISERSEWDYSMSEWSEAAAAPGLTRRADVVVRGTEGTEGRWRLGRPRGASGTTA